MSRREEEQVLYDVVSRMIGNVVTSLASKADSDALSEKDQKIFAKAKMWGEGFLRRLDDTMEYKRYKGTVRADLNEGSWNVRIAAIKNVHTVDYLDGRYLFSTAGAENYQIDLTDPANPTVR
ncbi:MAG TPA: hypothetical protein VN081_05760 [Dongiaceae bacterium]|nr:hypothetical protein [Dongiaceae bacterium]